MARKIVLFGTILGLIFVIANYHFLGQKQPENAKKEITIFTRDTLAGIHAKMILGENGIVTLESTENITEKQKNLIKNANIIIETASFEESKLKSVLQEYKGIYLTVPVLSSNEVLHENDTLSKQIVGIRDAIVDIDKTNPGYYYDNAGNYIHLIETLYESIQNRLSKYHKAKFITIGGDFDTFIKKFKLTDYHSKHYKNPKEFTNDKTVKDFLRVEKINHIFIFSPLNDYEVRNIEKTYSVTLYRLPQIEEDTSAWGYLRYLEKVADQFVRAFDTYD